MRQRDNFPKRVKENIAARVNHRCSNPTCRASTSGPQLDHGKAINIGVAAHIAAAAEGGPRFDASMPNAERSSARNAIWLCQNCAKLIDNDEQRFSHKMLKDWKKDAEELAKSRIGRPSLFDRDDQPDFRFMKASSLIDHLNVAKEAFNDNNTVDSISKFLPGDAKNCARKELLAQGVGLSGGMYSIIGTSFDDGWNWKIFFMNVGEFGWHVVGQTTLDSQKGNVPQVTYIPGTPGALVLEHLSSYGTGLYFVSVSWYRITPDRIKPIISYPRKFYVNGWGMPFDRYLDSETLRSPARLSSGQFLVSRFSIRYEIAGNKSNAFMKELLFLDELYLSLEWNEEAGVFVPQTSADDFSIINQIWGEDTEGFVKRNASRLKHLLSNGNAKQKAFAEKQLSTIHL